ncbi:pentapeptide repeat-containing protein [Synechococcus sp. CBW1002]|uniref:pentapeptide repeat-containing protein n=1 Tax=Synechococcus sp. CBW1002 TaxID=1353134 RepID=UPI0018CD0910|nr:pentapeptide repeat-containing protein [Synechococcus sp. CBW1002]QPN60484.1 pentapeptide repeat-containing protein [Synechococcus sp. CBW1002]
MIRTQRRNGRIVAPMIGAFLLTAAAAPSWAADQEQLMQLLDRKTCPACRLQDADLVHADLRDADLQQARLQRANLSRAQLDGADLRQADLSFSSLMGASLRGADLRGAKLEGTDLRDADLSGAQLDADALAKSHWRGATGVTAEASSYAAMHNAGVEAALQGRYPEAEDLFNKALLKQPDAALTWLARGISRAEQSKRDLAAMDFNYAATLFEQQGQKETAEQLRKGAADLAKDPNKSGNGFGSGLLQGAIGVFQQLAPLAIKMFAPAVGF